MLTKYSFPLTYFFKLYQILKKYKKKKLYLYNSFHRNKQSISIIEVYK